MFFNAFRDTTDLLLNSFEISLAKRNVKKQVYNIFSISIFKVIFIKLYPWILITFTNMNIRILGYTFFYKNCDSLFEKRTLYVLYLLIELFVLVDGYMQVLGVMQVSYIAWTWLIEGRPRATITALFLFTCRGVLGYCTQLPLSKVHIYISIIILIILLIGT